MGKEGNPVGRISKQWAGLIKESLTDSDNFGINFPIDLDVRMKAVLMGACFLIVRYYTIIHLPIYTAICVFNGTTSLCPAGLHVLRADRGLRTEMQCVWLIARRS